MQPLDPYSPPRTDNLKPLGSLAQSARGKEISRARTILIVIGILTILGNGFLLYNLPSEIQEAIRVQNVPPAQIAEFTQAVNIAGYLIYGGPLLLGVLFVMFGLIVQKYPLTITITSLVLFIGATIIFAILSPATVLQGGIFKVIIIVALVRAIKAAKAYDTDTKKAAFSNELLA